MYVFFMFRFLLEKKTNKTKDNFPKMSPIH